MEFLSHVITGLTAAVGGLAGGWIWFRRQLNTARAERLETDRAQLELSKAQTAAEEARDATASIAWKELFDELARRCEAERAEAKIDRQKQDARIEELQKQVLKFVEGAAERNAEIIVLKARVAQLEKLFPDRAEAR